MPPKALGARTHGGTRTNEEKLRKEWEARNASKDGSDIQPNDKARSCAVSSSSQDAGEPSNSPEQMNRKRKEMMTALKDILQRELDTGSEVGDGALHLEVEEISIIATIAVRSDNDGKGECLLKLTCGKDDPHVRKPSVEKLPESDKKPKEAMKNWSMVDVLDDIKKVMAKSEAAASGRQAK